jgi:hypothetical protein
MAAGILVMVRIMVLAVLVVVPIRFVLVPFVPILVTPFVRTRSVLILFVPTLFARFILFLRRQVVVAVTETPRLRQARRRVETMVESAAVVQVRGPVVVLVIVT